MSQVFLAKAVWDGIPSGTGVTQLAFLWDGGAVDSTLSDLHNFFNAITAQLPATVGVTVHQEADLFDPASGDLEGTVTAATALPRVVGTGSGTYANGSGCSVIWETGSIARSRRCRGRTYLVPLVGSAYQSDGTLAAGTISAIQGAANAIVTSTAARSQGLQVWSRPNAKYPSGVINQVISALVKDQPAGLQTRRY